MLYLDLKDVIYQSKGALMWSSRIRWIPTSASYGAAEILFNSQAIRLQVMGFNKFEFKRAEIEIQTDIFRLTVGYGFQILHQQENTPQGIIFGFALSRERRDDCVSKLKETGFVVS